MIVGIRAIAALIPTYNLPALRWGDTKGSIPGQGDLLLHGVSEIGGGWLITLIINYDILML
jgi:hypothetical protein